MAQIFDLSQLAESNASLDLQGETNSPLSQFQHGVSVIVVIDQAGIPFLQALQSLLKQKYLRELIVVDRGSPKELLDTLQKISSELPYVRVIPHQAHLSFLQAYNMAAKRAYGRYLLFLDQHAVLPVHGIRNLLLASLEKKGKFWIIAARVNPQKTTVLQQLLDPKQAVLALLGLKKPQMHFSLDDRALSDHIPSVGFGCFMIPRQGFWQSDGFDQTILGNASMMDLCLKIHLQGGGIYQMRDMKVRMIDSVKDFHISNLKGIISFYNKHYRQSSTRRWLMPLYGLLLMKTLFWTLKNKLSKKSKSNREPTLADLLNKQTLA